MKARKLTPSKKRPSIHPRTMELLKGIGEGPVRVGAARFMVGPDGSIEVDIENMPGILLNSEERALIRKAEAAGHDTTPTSKPRRTTTSRSQPKGGK